jgi:hypothetical protein
MMTSVAVLFVLHAGLAAAGGEANANANANANTSDADSAARGTVSGFAADIAVAIENRARVEGLTGTVRLVLDEIRGLDPTKVRTALLPRVRRAMKAAQGPIVPGDSGGVTATIAISEERGQLWAVVVLEGDGLAGPSTVVVTHPIDRELEIALGAVGASIPGRFVLERIGALPAPRDLAKGNGKGERRCPVLDVVMVDYDGDPSQELAVLSTCGVSIYRADDSGVSAVAGPYALPAQRWPRIPLGWIVALPMRNGDVDANNNASTSNTSNNRGSSSAGGNGQAPQTGPVVWVATSAGHSVLMELKTGQVSPAPPDRVPLRGVVSKDGPFSLHWRLGSPSLALPVVTPGGIDILLNGLPGRLRDLAQLPQEETFVFVTDEGSLAVRDDGGVASIVAPERVGDRLLVVDVDADGDAEIITTTASSPGEPDQLVLRRLMPGADATTVLLKSPLSGGSIVGLAAGFSDYDARTDIIALEESVGGEVMVWRLEHSP